MISVEEALGLIDKYRPNYGAVQRSLLDANGYALAQNVLARFTQPPFPTSIMDGYALRKKDLFDKLTVVGESRAGKPFDGVIGEKEAVRIFTGATLFPKQSKNRNYIRAVGSDFISGDLLFEGSTRITPRVISALASANVASVTVNQKPTIALLRGGDELRPVGSALQPGQIIDSNGPSLIALLTAIQL